MRFSRPDMTFAVDWVLKDNYLSIYRPLWRFVDQPLIANVCQQVLEGTKLLIRSHHRTKMELTNETECNLLLERWSSSDCQRAMEAYLANENNFSS